jgi:ribosomal protein S21
MPAQSQQQQKLFGLALAFKRGEVKSSEVSDEIKGIADRMSEKEIEDFAKTTHKGLPKMKEQLRKIVREIMREKVISEMNESVINEGYSTEEKRIVMMAVRKLSKYRSVPIDQSINDLLGAGAELQRDIKKGKIKK